MNHPHDDDFAPRPLGLGRSLHALEPISFAGDVRAHLRLFVGRKWVLAAAREWLDDPSGARVFWITGAPGAGKSAIAAWLSRQLPEVAASHFCDSNSEEKRDPARMVRSLVFQLAERLPEFALALERLPIDSIVEEYREASTLFDKLLVQPLALVGRQPDTPTVLLIDALDEAPRERQAEIVRCLAMGTARTPTWLRFLVTSRPEPGLVSRLASLAYFELDTAGAANQTDLRSFLAGQLPDGTALEVEHLLDRCEGLFLYARQAVEAVRSGQLSLSDVDEFPRGLGDLYLHFFDRQFGTGDGDAVYDEQIVPLLQPILAAAEPLGCDFLREHCALRTETELRRRLNRLGALFPVERAGRQETVRPFHNSLREWLTDAGAAGRFTVAVSDGHRSLAEQGWAQLEQGAESLGDYFLRWLPTHLLAIGDEERLVVLLRDFDYLMAKCRRGFAQHLLADYRCLPRSLTSPGAPLRYFTAFFRERAHLLRRADADWPAHRILLQLAVEHADDSPLAIGAESWLEQGRCTWLWLRRVPRLRHTEISPCQTVLEGHREPVQGALDLGHERLLSWSLDGTLRLWDAGSGDCRRVLADAHEPVLGALVSSDGTPVSWSTDGHLRLWDCATGQCRARLAGHEALVRGARLLAPDRLVSWSDDGTLRIWDLATAQLLVVCEGHEAAIGGVLEVADGRLLSWSHDHTARLWDPRRGTCQGCFECHQATVMGALPLPNGRIVSWAGDGSLRAWALHHNRCRTVLAGHADVINGALLLPDNALLTWAGGVRSGDHSLGVWELDSGERRHALAGHSAPVKGALLLTDGSVLSWSDDGTLRIWNTVTGECLSCLSRHADWVNGAEELPDGQILSWSNDAELRLWDREGRSPRRKLLGHSGPVQGALILAQRRLLSWSEDGSLRLWRYAPPAEPSRPFASPRQPHQGSPEGLTRASRATLSGHAEAITGALRLADGRLLSWSRDCTLRLWDAEQGFCTAVLEGHTGPVSGATQLSGGTLLSWSTDHTLRLWDREEGIALHTLSGHTAWVVGAMELENGRLLSWSTDNTLRVWNPGKGTCLDALYWDQAAERYPEWVLEHHQLMSGFTEYRTGSCELSAAGRVATLAVRAGQEVIRWHAEGELAARCLLPDGTVVLSQAIGQLCILKLHHGLRRLSLDQAALIPDRNEPT